MAATVTNFGESAKLCCPSRSLTQKRFAFAAEFRLVSSAAAPDLALLFGKRLPKREKAHAIEELACFCAVGIDSQMKLAFLVACKPAARRSSSAQNVLDIARGTTQPRPRPARLLTLQRSCAMRHDMHSAQCDGTQFGTELQTDIAKTK